MKKNITKAAIVIALVVAFVSIMGAMRINASEYPEENVTVPETHVVVDVVEDVEAPVVTENVEPEVTEEVIEEPEMVVEVVEPTPTPAPVQTSKPVENTQQEPSKIIVSETPKAEEPVKETTPVVSVENVGIPTVTPEPTAEPTPEPTPEITPEPTPEPVHVHNYEIADVFAPNCTTNGYTVYVCSCGDSHLGDETPASEHTYISNVVAPTEESEGYTQHICTGCGDSYKDNYTDKLVIEVEVTPEPEVSEEPNEETTPSESTNNSHVCDPTDGHCHEEMQVGGYTYVYCDEIEAPYRDGFVIHYPYDFYF